MQKKKPIIKKKTPVKKEKNYKLLYEKIKKELTQTLIDSDNIKDSLMNDYENAIRKIKIDLNRVITRQQKELNRLNYDAEKKEYSTTSEHIQKLAVIREQSEKDNVIIRNLTFELKKAEDFNETLIGNNNENIKLINSLRVELKKALTVTGFLRYKFAIFGIKC